MKPITAIGWSCGTTISPALPFTIAGRAKRAKRGARARTCSRDGCRSGRDRARTGDHHPATVGAEDDVRVEHLDERLEVAVAGRGEERVHDLALPLQIRIRHRSRAADAPPRAACELTGRGRAPLDDRRDLLERHPEHVVQDEGEPLRRRQRVEHDEQREADRVGEQRLVLGAVRRQRDDRLRQLRADEVLATRAAGAQQVEADAGDDRRQPAAHVLDLARLRAVADGTTTSCTASSASLSEPSIR